MVAGLTYKQRILLTPYTGFVWRGLLWHTGAYLGGRYAFNRDIIKISGVSVDASRLVQLASLAQLENGALIGGYAGSYCVIDNYVYIRMRHETQTAVDASSQEWLFRSISIGVEMFMSDTDFKVIGGKNIKYAITSAYHNKSSAEPHTYKVLNFNSFKFSLLRKRLNLEPEDLIGNFITFNSDNLESVYEKSYIENITYNFDIMNIACKDIRSMISDNVIDQQFTKADYKNASGNSVIDDDVAKRYKADAAGYCTAVPGDCLNGYAFDTQNYRKYRFGYGSIEVDYFWTNNQELRRGVEVAIENGWRVLERGNGPGTNVWWTESIDEMLPNGTSIKTTLICIPTLVAHPPQLGIVIPDYEATPRTLRVTGWFHTELGKDTITMPREILKYLFSRYCSLPYLDMYFNLPEINTELSALDNAPCGIYLDKPSKLYDVVGKLQNGCIYGWQLMQHQGLITARVDNPNRPVSWNIKRSDIKNISELQIDCNGGAYVSNAAIKYAYNYAEDTAKEYINIETEQIILTKRNLHKSKNIDTLLKDESDAIIRYGEEIRDGINIIRSVSGIQLIGDKWKGMRIYDICEADISIDKENTLIKGTFKIMMVDFNTKTPVQI